jgi:LPXTG-site transpeptidase (sortase) family protein
MNLLLRKEKSHEAHRKHLSSSRSEGDIPDNKTNAAIRNPTLAGPMRTVHAGRFRFRTALPGQTGNVVLAAHRDIFFRRFGVTVPGRQYLYSVRFTDVVDPNETWVLEPSTDQLLTLITCYPFYYTGPAPKRFIVRARRLDDE